jgi:hypothetical protein
MKTRIAVVLGFATLLAGTASGQGGQLSETHSVPYATSVVAGRPYSAEEVAEWKQTLSDGTQISHPTSTIKIFRDSAGRTRSERALIVEIHDVVAGYRYILDTTNKVAHRSAILPRPAVADVAHSAGPKAVDGSPRREFTNESLGTQIIEGLTCQGSRFKMTYPVGTKGNDRPIIVSIDSWTSPELSLMVLSKHSDPRMGVRIVQTKNISRVDPEYSLFQPPPDYKIVDEAGSFELIINLP